MKPYGRTRVEVRRGLTSGELRVAVYGLGKMGLPLAAALASRGARVIGADIDPTVAAGVDAGQCHVRGEPGLATLVAQAHDAGLLRATSDLRSAAREAAVHIVIVPTLLSEPDKTTDLSAVDTACAAIAGGLKPGDLFIQESTTPPGTTVGRIREALERGSGHHAGRDFGLAFCPERTLSGRAVEDILRGHPKVVGGLDAASSDAAAGLYDALNDKGVIQVSSPTVAEAVKVFEGVYRDVNIALANELFRACEEWGIGWRETFETANTQPYCHLHRPGLGVGGHCIPVYPWFAIGATSAPLPLTRLARDVNDGMVDHWVARASGLLGGTLKDKRVLVVGVTYRPGVAETRYAPALRLIETLRRAGADVRAEDPLVVVADAPRPEEGWHADIALVNHGEPRAPHERRLQVGAPDEISARSPSG